MPRFTALDHELFYLVSSMPVLDERARQLSLKKFITDFTKSKNKKSLHPTTKQTFWSTAILALHRTPTDELIGIILKMLKSNDIDFNQYLRSNNGDIHSAVLVASGLFNERASNISDKLRWLILENLLKQPNLNLKITSSNNTYATNILEIVWKHKTNDETCKRVLEILKKLTGDNTSNPVALFNEADVLKEINKLEKDTVQGNFLKKLVQSGVYRKAQGKPVASTVEQLLKKFPNFESVINAILPELALYNISLDPLFQMMPLLLVGDPGIGKTRFVHALATSLNLDFKRVDCGGVTAHWVLSGMNGSWKDAKPGEIANTLMEGTSINPLIMLDEIDKLSGDRQTDPFNVLHNLIEKDTAKTFKDECLGVPINASHISWLATANSTSSIPNSIQSRFRILNIPTPSKEQMPAIVDSIYEDLLTEHATSWGSRFSKSLPDDTKALLIEVPRDLKKLLLTACGQAAKSRKNDIYDVLPADIIAANGNTHIKKAKMGFHSA